MDDKLFLDNAPLINLVIKKMGLYNLEEYYLIGEEALVKAIKKFDKSKGYKFSSYATKAIQYELLKHLNYKKRKKRKYDDYLISLDEEINDNKGTLLDLLSDGTDLEKEIIENEKIQLLKTIISILEPKDKFMMEHYFELWGNKKMNQKEIAKVLNAKEGYVSYRIKRAMRIIKKIMEDKYEKEN